MLINIVLNNHLIMLVKYLLTVNYAVFSPFVGIISDLILDASEKGKLFINTNSSKPRFIW